MNVSQRLCPPWFPAPPVASYILPTVWRCTQVSVEKGTWLIIIEGVKITISWFIPKGKITKIKSHINFCWTHIFAAASLKSMKMVLDHLQQQHQEHQKVCSCGDVCQCLCALHTDIFFALADCRTAADPKSTVQIFTQRLLDQKSSFRENNFSVDLRKDQEEQDRSYVSFYKRRNVEWASPLRCTLKGVLFI